MMKKKIWWAGALSVAIAASGVYGYNAVQAAGSGQTTAAGTQAATKQQQQLIGMEKAEQLALAAASGKVESIDIDRKRASWCTMWRSSRITGTWMYGLMPIPANPLA